ncbi:hypothetical protein D0N87_35065, partial [Pseudomonas sp. ATCC 13867]
MSQHSGSPYRCFYPAGIAPWLRSPIPEGSSLNKPTAKGVTAKTTYFDVVPRQHAEQAGSIRFSVC